MRYCFCWRLGLFVVTFAGIGCAGTVEMSGPVAMRPQAAELSTDDADGTIAVDVPQIRTVFDQAADPDPKLRIRRNGVVVCETRVEDNTRSPIWNLTCDPIEIAEDTQLDFEILDDDLLHDDLLAVCSIVGPVPVSEDDHIVDYDELSCRGRGLISMEIAIHPARPSRLEAVERTVARRV